MSTSLNVVTVMIGNGSVDQTSVSAKSDGYYGHSDGEHTLSVQFSDFLGRIQLEGTLVLEPEETDWFPIALDGDDYIEFTVPQNGTLSYNYRGNIVLSRFKKIRSYLSSTSSIGDISKVMLSI